MWKEVSKNSRFLIKHFEGQFQIWRNVIPIDAPQENYDYSQLCLEGTKDELCFLLQVLIDNPL